MKCRGDFVYKSLTLREGGQFTNEKGDAIKYDEAYVLKVDEDIEGNIQERKFKFPTTNKKLADDLRYLQPYTKITLEFNVSLYNNQARLLPLEIVEE